MCLLVMKYLGPLNVIGWWMKIIWFSYYLFTYCLFIGTNKLLSIFLEPKTIATQNCQWSPYWLVKMTLVYVVMLKLTCFKWHFDKVGWNPKVSFLLVFEVEGESMVKYVKKLSHM